MSVRAGLLPAEIEESNRLLSAAWSLFACGCPGGEILRFPGVTAAFGHTRINFFNALFFSSPVDSPSDLDRRLALSAAYGSAAGVAWFLGICDEWIPADWRAEGRRRIAAAGFVPGDSWTGMAAAELLPPRRPAPEVRLVPVRDAATRAAVSDLNCLCYDAPIPWGRETIDRELFWPPASFGSVAYLDGEAVSTATTLAVNGWLYVALVATAPEYRRRGYAEAAMRHSLERAFRETGWTRMALHATPSGLPLYSAMGFRPVASFSMYSYRRWQESAAGAEPPFSPGA